MTLLKTGWLRFVALIVSASLAGCSTESTESTPTPPATTTASVTVQGSYSLLVGQTEKLTAQTANATNVTEAYEWQSEDPTVATVAADGTVTALQAGVTIILATGVDSQATGDHPLVVIEPQAPLPPLVTLSGAVLVQVGQLGQIAATTTNATDSSYLWLSSAEAVATVDAQGAVKGISPGAVTISATGADSQATGTRDIVVTFDVPNYTLWVASAHADVTAEAFNHWNGDSPAEIPVACARCHSTPGFKDYLGADGTTPFVVDQPAPIGTVIECVACHNATADALAKVIFPGTATAPGVEIDGLDSASARCMTCHQGRESTASVDAAITAAGVGSDDEQSAALSFKNVHYAAAGATQQGGRVSVGYEYANRAYDWRFRHVPGKDTCTGCHDPHSLEVRVTECKTCHDGISTVTDLKTIRTMSSFGLDYDGDGNVSEGIAGEIQGLQDKLLSAIVALPAAQSPAGPAICYDGGAYPYWFLDTNANGVCDGTEVAAANGYNAWTARLVRATFNYQLSVKEPGAYAHNAKYMIELLYDSIEDIENVVTTPLLTNAVRTDIGHFDGSDAPARHWDADGAVDAACAKCHSGSVGYRFFLSYGVNIPVGEPGNGLDCGTCHENVGTVRPGQNLPTIATVALPGGANLNLGSKSNLCGTCHSGRVGKADIDAKIATNTYSFLDVHYLASASVMAGTLGKVGYEYGGKTYSSRFSHPGGLGGNQCTFCHNPALTEHTFDVVETINATGCGCHNAPTLAGLRMDSTDWNGNGNTTEPLADEVLGIADDLLQVMHTYSVSHGNPLCYAVGSYPYYFKDTHSVASGSCDPADAVFSNQYTAWDATLMKAAHNNQLARKDTGSWAHNKKYILQLLIDSIADVDPLFPIGNFVRPAP